DRIDVFLWLAVGLWFANGLLLFALLRQVCPRAAAVPWLASALLVLHHADPYRYLALWATNVYLTGLVFFQASLWLLLVSYKHQRRTLLTVSCLLLAASLMNNEGLFPLALLGPVLLRLRERRGRALGTWVGFWLGTVALLALRFGLFARSGASQLYQVGL